MYVVHGLCTGVPITDFNSAFCIDPTGPSTIHDVITMIHTYPPVPSGTHAYDSQQFLCLYGRKQVVHGLDYLSGTPAECGLIFLPTVTRYTT